MKKLTTLFLLLTLIACGPAAITTPTVTPVPSSTPAPMATSTSAPTATSTQIPGAPIERCVEILPEFPEGNVPSGTLVVDVLLKGISLFNFQQQTQRLIAGYFDGVGTSPDGKWLSYITYVNSNDEVIFIESSDGEKKFQLPFESEWMVFGNPWLSNEQLSFLTWDGGYGLKTVALNPFTGKQQAFLPDYPNFNNNYLYGPVGSLPLFFRYSNVANDSSLRFVVYPQDNDDGLYDALWDRETNQEIAKVLTGLYLPPPLWLSDSHAFVVTAFPRKNSQREWFMVGVDGEIRQLTHFADIFPKFKIGIYASVSPDGRYLAFGMSSENDPSISVPMDLVILDLITMDSFNTCISFNSDPIWSPDSQYLVVAPDPNPNRSSIIVLNVESGWAASIFPKDDEVRIPDGWLASGE